MPIVRSLRAVLITNVVLLAGSSTVQHITSSGNWEGLLRVGRDYGPQGKAKPIAENISQVTAKPGEWFNGITVVTGEWE